jgi:hypothetical protein
MLTGEPEIFVIPIKSFGRVKSEFDACNINDILPVTGESIRTIEQKLFHIKISLLAQ